VVALPAALRDAIGRLVMHRNAVGAPSRVVCAIALPTDTVLPDDLDVARLARRERIRFSTSRRAPTRTTPLANASADLFRLPARRHACAPIATPPHRSRRLSTAPDASSRLGTTQYHAALVRRPILAQKWVRPPGWEPRRAHGLSTMANVRERLSRRKLARVAALTDSLAAVLNASQFGCPDPGGHRDGRCFEHASDQPNEPRGAVARTPVVFRRPETESLWVAWRSAGTQGTDRALRAWIEGRARRAKIPTSWITPDPYAKASVTRDPRTGAVIQTPSRPRLPIVSPRADAIDLVMRVFQAAHRAGAWAALGVLHRCPVCRWFYVSTDLRKQKYCTWCREPQRLQRTRDRVRRHRKQRRGQTRGGAVGNAQMIDMCR
jgi:hypothetical protein